MLAGIPSPSARMSPNITPTTQAAGIASSPTSPISVHSLRDRVMSPPQELPKAPGAAADPPATPRLPFFEKFKNKLPAVDTAKATDPIERSPPSPASSDSSYGGLAYANSDDDDGDELDIPLRASPQPLATPATPLPPAPAPAENKVRFPSMSESKYSSSSSSTANSPRLPQRSLSASTATTSYGVRTIAKSTGALDRAMETLFEDNPTSPTTSTSSRPFTEKQRESVSKSPKIPTRSHTSPTLSSGRLEERKSAQRRPRTKTKTCVRCVKPVEDGRWIQMEGGNVLCDKCWKNMYLPKVRPILRPFPSLCGRPGSSSVVQDAPRVIETVFEN